MFWDVPVLKLIISVAISTVSASIWKRITSLPVYQAQLNLLINHLIMMIRPMRFASQPIFSELSESHNDGTNGSKWISRWAHLSSIGTTWQAGTLHLCIKN
jgi:hypothetical protein